MRVARCDRERSQPGAAGECGVADGGDAGGEGDAGQPGAAEESEVADGGDRQADDLRGDGDGTGGVFGVIRDRDLSATDHLIGEQSGHVGPQGIGGAAKQQEAQPQGQQRGAVVRFQGLRMGGERFWGPVLDYFSTLSQAISFAAEWKTFLWSACSGAEKSEMLRGNVRRLAAKSKA